MREKQKVQPNLGSLEDYQSLAPRFAGRYAFLLREQEVAGSNPVASRASSGADLRAIQSSENSITK
jgi:hypothetical protein